jgi:hypothetical protein
VRGRARGRRGRSDRRDCFHRAVPAAPHRGTDLAGFGELVRVEPAEPVSSAASRCVDASVFLGDAPFSLFWLT